jgi:hypothetical protein
MTWRSTWAGIERVASFVALAAALAACSQDKKATDCVPAVGAAAATQPKVTSRRLFVDDQAGKKDNDWCRACVMGTKGYASCQRVYGDTPTEARDAIKERARVKACVDTGYTATACPASATIGIVCKGDPPPPGATDPGAALQNLYRSLNPNGPVAPKPSASPAPQAGSSDTKKPDKIFVE